MVNLETDLIGKYVKKLLGCVPGRDPGTQPKPEASGITMEMLRELDF